MISPLRTNASRRARYAFGASVMLAALVTSFAAQAADMPGDNVLRGSTYDIGPPAAVRWDGIVLGAQFGYSSMSVPFEDVSELVTFSNQVTTSQQFGGFLGYNIQWDNLVVGFDGAYNRLSSADTSTSSGTSSASFKLVDYGTFRARAGYAFGQFLPYAMLGGAVGRMNYATNVAGTTDNRDNAYAGGFLAGLGLDVSILPNVFLRAEYEYVGFSPVGNIRSTLQTGRAGIGVRF